jgi:magnesium transporter
MEEFETRPWIHLETLVAAGDARALEQFIAALSPGDTARAFANLPHDVQQAALTLLAPVHSAAAIVEMPQSQAAELVERLPSDDAAAIVSQLPSDERADLLSAIEESQTEAILAQMPREAAEITRELASHEADRAGGLMITEYLSYADDATVLDVLDDLRANAERYATYDVQYAYVVAPDRRLVGVLPLRDLLLAHRGARVSSVMIRDPRHLAVETPLDELREFFERYPYFGVPIVSPAGALVGVVRRADVREALETRAGRDHLKSQGIVGGEELRTMPVLRRSARRLSWLTVNVVLNLIAASVIAVYQETLTAVIALAVFLPIISDMSGCSGNQAVAVSIRELTLGLVRPIDAVRVWLKEISVGILNGAVLGVLVAAAAWLWKGNPALGAVVGGAMAVNTIVAVSIGGVVPLALKRASVDPALASGPILTTVTDMCGFFLLLSLATAFLPYLS